MKIFLGTCIVAMVSAGIYGTIDLAKDLREGTFIKYEDENATETKKISHVVSKKIKMVPAREEEIKTEKVIISENVTEKERKKKVPQIKMEYFSRSAPSMTYLRYLEEELAKDSLKAATGPVTSDTAKLLPVPGPEEKVAEKSEEIKIKEAPKFSPRLFSRGRPRNYKQEEMVVKLDSLAGDQKLKPE